MWRCLGSLLVLLALGQLSCAEQRRKQKDEDGGEQGFFSLLMPHVRPLKPETYLCTAVKLEPKVFYLTGFVPNATKQTAHHMLLYGCSSPGDRRTVWDCGEMAASSGWGLFRKSRSPCASDPQVIYGWAMDAPSLELPEGVGFRVGRGTPSEYLVLQVHYANVAKFRDGSTDDSGIFLHYTDRPQPRTAGVLALMTRGVIPPLSDEKMQVHCEIKEPTVIHPFAFRTHTHALGLSVSGYRVRPSLDGGHQWTLLGRRNPQLPQMFYPVFSNATLGPGDLIAAQCAMRNFRKRKTWIGPTNEDEMCNFYLMYWTEGDRALHMQFCVSAGPPQYYWRKYLTNIPEEDFSSR